ILFIILKSNDIAPQLTEIHFLLQVPILAVITGLLNVIISNASAPPPENKVESMTWSIGIFRAETKELAGLPWYQNYRILSVLLLILTAIIVIWYW
ncbi:MAG: sodium transporter, partial [Cyclobacteriaceae bacterium]